MADLSYRIPLARQLGWGALVLVAVGCRRPATETESTAAPDPSSGVAGASNSALLDAPSKEKATSRCASTPGQFTLSPADAEKDGRGEPNIELPFAVEIGSAVAYKDGFAIASLRGGSGQTTASITLLPASLSSGRLVELGAIHGDVAAPKLAAKGEALIVVVPDSDASGDSLRLARVMETPAGGDVAWGAVLKDGDDESQAFEVALGNEDGVVIWDDWDKAKNNGVIRASGFNVSELDKTRAPEVLSLSKVDAESPRVVERAGGFWAAWVVNDEVQRRGVRPRSSASLDDDDQDEERTLVPTRRGIEVRPLDDRGHPAGSATRITPEGALALDFDLAPASDGGAWVVWREGAPSVANAGGKLRLVSIAADGTQTEQRLDEIELGSGSPVLLTNPQVAAEQWLLVPGAKEETEIARLGTTLEPLAQLSTDAALRYSIPLALRETELLLAHPRRRSVVLHTASCK